MLKAIITIALITKVAALGFFLKPTSRAPGIAPRDKNSMLDTSGNSLTKVAAHSHSPPRKPGRLSKAEPPLHLASEVPESIKVGNVRTQGLHQARLNLPRTFVKNLSKLRIHHNTIPDSTKRGKTLISITKSILRPRYARTQGSPGRRARSSSAHPPSMMAAHPRQFRTETRAVLAIVALQTSSREGTTK